MSSEKAWYLVAVAVLGFGLASRLEQRSWDASRAVDQVLHQATDTVETTVAALTDQQEEPIVLSQVAVFRANQRLACINSRVAREQARIERLHAKAIRSVNESCR